jgi:uncharacterized protein YegL
MSEWKDFTKPRPEPLPVLLVCDVSGSMRDHGKIEALNQAVREMIASFAAEPVNRAELHVAVITFGGEAASVHTPLQSAARVTWVDMTAAGRTPLGHALTLAAELIENTSIVPSSAFRPAVVLVSDGIPTDDWKTGNDRLTRQGRAQKAERFAVAIGGDADESMLQAFLGGPDRKLFHAEDATRIIAFFNYVRMSVTSRSRTANPNVSAPVPSPFDADDF